MAELPWRWDRGVTGSIMAWLRRQQNARRTLTGRFKPGLDHVDVTSTFTVTRARTVLEKQRETPSDRQQ